MKVRFTAQARPDYSFGAAVCMILRSSDDVVYALQIHVRSQLLLLPMSPIAQYGEAASKFSLEMSVPNSRLG